jgi:O-antigen ligase
MVRVALLVGTVILLIIVVPLLADFSSHLAVSSADISFLGRLVAFASAGQVFLQSPVIGIGYGNFRNLMDFDLFDLQGNTWDAHNLYLQLLAETGVLGFLAFALLFLLALLSAARMRREDNDVNSPLGFAALAALCSVAAHGLVDYLFNASPQFGTLFWTILAMVAAFQGSSVLGRFPFRRPIERP